MGGRKTVIIRSLNPEDMKESMRLSQFAFQFELAPEELKERLARLKPEEAWGMFTEDGELAAKLTLLPLEAYIGGQALPMGGIAGVATWPEYRRGGLVKRLLQHALTVMKERGQTVSFLHPFQFEFYRRFGWETYTEYKKYELDMAQVPRFPEASGQVKQIREIGVLRGVYEAYAKRYNGMLARSESWWEWNIMTLKNKGGTAAVYTDEDGAPSGYILYKVRDQVLTVNEWVALDMEAAKGLWSFIGNHDSMAKKVTLQQEAGSRLTSLLKDPRVKQEVVPYFMARLVDAEAFLAGYGFREGAAGSLRLAVKDEYAPWNEGLYELELGQDGKAKVRFTPAENPEAPADGVACGIGVLTSMLLGYERPLFWLESGRLSGSREAVELLEKAIPKRSTYLLDFF